MKIATWNIGSLYFDRKQNAPYIKNVVSLHRQDILCMQEFPENDSIAEDIKQWGRYSEMLFLTTSESHINSGNNMGVAIFSKCAIKTVDTVCLPRPTVEVSYKGVREYWHTKYFLANLCETEGGAILLVTGHGFPFHRYKLENPEGYEHIRPPFAFLDSWIADLSNRYPNIPICMAADFNVSDPLLFMPYTAEHFYDAFKGDGTRPSGRKTDAILLPVGRKLTRKENFSLLKSNGEPVFDHNFISTEFEL